LQFEADLIDAARRIDREYELQIDGRLRRRPSGESKHHEHCPRNGAPDPGAPKMGVKAAVHCRRLDMGCPVMAKMHDHHGNLIDFHTQFSTVVEATEVGTRRQPQSN
jgi:hypothetical protein